ncbi:unnamed protein product [Rotaria sordida]|uniref:NAD(P)(+)--arginine ADP-ribosyltransferase n=1 Tax=Rotaria sordida TaxID=392033 RepID=A0A816D826_9BILA|nr:unnamed protein product [Rotaria sordida]CAF1436985.1 unnamed protein product [Rotaria sordida]CAF1507318.1 unnamed protein product [Rotaria sordida]CAF1513172.1 unnamed protein product [Rotaria sordida]CAF1631474.1 unnamed protein product [Rotaria sordida]
MQWEEPNVSLFTKLNKILRSERREPLKPWFRYLKLILTALYKLPSLRMTVWRGVCGNLSDQYDEEHIWWGFSSCTESVEVMEQFVGKSGIRTLFNIECINGKSIKAHSFFKKENEILLLPGTYFRVVGKWSPSKDLYMIHMRETLPPRPYLEPPFDTTSSDVPVSKKSQSSIEAPSEKGVISWKQKSSQPAATRSSKPKEQEEFASPDTHNKLDCNGRACTKCRKCREWQFTGNKDTWKWIQNCKNWSEKDGQRWNHERLWNHFRRRDGATCHWDLAYYFVYNYGSFQDDYVLYRLRDDFDDRDLNDLYDLRVRHVCGCDFE